MFAIVYRVYLKPGRESDYRRLWHQVASYFKAHRGALGSCLHQAGDGMWLAYSRWPDRKTWSASWPGDKTPSNDLPEEIRTAIHQMRECFDLEHRMPDIEMDVISDLLMV